MTMTKKDYESIAAGISDCFQKEWERHSSALQAEHVLYVHTRSAVIGVASQLAIKFKFSNGSFDINKFMRAYGVQEGEIDAIEAAERKRKAGNRAPDTRLEGGGEDDERG